MWFLLTPKPLLLPAPRRMRLTGRAAAETGCKVETVMAGCSRPRLDTRGTDYRGLKNFGVRGRLLAAHQDGRVSLYDTGEFRLLPKEQLSAAQDLQTVKETAEPHEDENGGLWIRVQVGDEPVFFDEEEWERGLKAATSTEES